VADATDPGDDVRHRRRWWQHTVEEIYVYRTQKPHAVVGLPFIGRHFAYGGRTNNPKRRDSEHLVGGGRYNAPPKPWADLRPRRYVVFRLKRRAELTTRLLELLVIRGLFPVYNVTHNMGNPRRIKPFKAARQRAHRDAYGTTARLAPAVLRAGVASTALLIVMVVGSRVTL
jgi:hypothetical protein